MHAYPRSVGACVCVCASECVSVHVWMSECVYSNCEFMHKPHPLRKHIMCMFVCVCVCVCLTPLLYRRDRTRLCVPAIQHHQSHMMSVYAGNPPTPTDLHFSSHHPRHVKEGVVSCLFHRARTSLAGQTNFSPPSGEKYSLVIRLPRFGARYLQLFQRHVFGMLIYDIRDENGPRGVIIVVD